MSLKHESKLPFEHVSSDPIDYQEYCELERIKVMVAAEANDIALARLLLDKALADGTDGKPSWDADDRIMFDGAMERIAGNRIAEIEVEDAPVIPTPDSTISEDAPQA